MQRFLLLILLVVGPLRATLPGQVRPSSAEKGLGLKCGPLADQVFKCPKLGFSLGVPFGWVDRTKEMQLATTPPTDGFEQPAKSSGSEVLMAVFEHPPEVRGDTVNSAIVIAAESLEKYPQIKSAADYFGPISDLAQARGFSADGEPYPFLVGSRRLIRGDFNREQGKLRIWQSSLVMIESHSIVSFTFIGGSDQETDDLIDRLSFSSPKTK